MKQILVVEASASGEESVSRRIAAEVEARLRAAHPEARVVRRDLARQPVPHLDESAVRALRARGAGGPLSLSDELADELLASDAVVISSPMWNFGIPSSLKAWIDHVMRAGKTFAYSEKGPVGLAAGKKAILITASGGVYSAGPMQSSDFAEPYLRRVLNFIGISDVQSVRVEGVAVPSLREDAIDGARKAVQTLAV